MGKKKASRGRKLRPKLEQAIREGKIFVRTKSEAYLSGPENRESGRNPKRKSRETYEVCLGSDQGWFDGEDDFFVPIFVYLDEAGDLTWHFGRSRDHVLARTDADWLTGELEQIIVMHKLGGFTSEKKATAYGSDSSEAIWRYGRPKKKKKGGLPRVY